MAHIIGLDYLDYFKCEAMAWVCNGYAVDLKFIAYAGNSDNSLVLWDAWIGFSPIYVKENNSFIVNANGLILSHTRFHINKSEEVQRIIQQACVGYVIQPNVGHLFLPESPKHGMETIRCENGEFDRNSWYSPLRMEVSNGERNTLTSSFLWEVDNMLRLAETPFDGLMDACSCLGLPQLAAERKTPKIRLEISPPADLNVKECTLSNGELLITILAHANFEVSTLKLALRAVPGSFFSSRKQIADAITWTQDGELQKGTARVCLTECDQVLLMLMIGTVTVRRSWVADPNRAHNNRLLAIQHFDKDFKRTNDAILTSDSRLFEKGIASLLFVLGFSPVQILEGDAPDLIVTTPGGQLIIVECTLKISDFQSKAGKLVDRRGSLMNALQESGHALNVVSVLICRVPRNRIAADINQIRNLGIILLTEEDIRSALDERKFPRNPDELVRLALENLTKLEIN